LECIYALRSFGVPAGAIPLGTDTITAAMAAFIEERQIIEANTAANDIFNSYPGRIIYPVITDVVLGRGRPYQGTFFKKTGFHHTGSIRA
jgi:hypothetical protein